MSLTRDPVPRGTNPYPWVSDIPFDPAKPFAAASLGCFMNLAATVDPTAANFRHVVSAGVADDRGNPSSVGAFNAVVNPADLAQGCTWWKGGLEPADMIVLRPFFVKYASAAHAGFGAAANVGTLTAKLTAWTTHRPQSVAQYRPCEYECEFLWQVQISNAALVVDQGTFEYPRGAQFCDVATIITDKSISPGVRFKGDSVGGALEIYCDQQRGSGLLIMATSIPASCGVGWRRSHM